ncbi:hypothetical protein RJ639_018633 [Escallonia herrerae]|uniref:Uncharacterized protein n=1 Tax=Escallonia herrerae TaxID=1293975 RepID=A0AA89AHR6_9ASTE|nr:hypothetical protein RJ639_018633 [Escallonia herrerae]
MPMVMNAQILEEQVPSLTKSFELLARAVQDRDVRIAMLLRKLEDSGDAEVTTPLLKFMAEFVLNKAQRLTFDSSSPNGILLFREVSKLLVAYGSRILSVPNTSDIYAFKYKGIWIALTILTRALAGNYVNFGVFELYGDRALADALDIALKMTLSVPLADILAFRKVVDVLGICGGASGN